MFNKKTFKLHYNLYNSLNIIEIYVVISLLLIIIITTNVCLEKK